MTVKCVFNSLMSFPFFCLCSSSTFVTPRGPVSTGNATQQGRPHIMNAIVQMVGQEQTVMKKRQAMGPLRYFRIMGISVV